MGRCLYSVCICVSLLFICFLIVSVILMVMLYSIGVCSSTCICMGRCILVGVCILVVDVIIISLKSGGVFGGFFVFSPPSVLGRKFSKRSRKIGIVLVENSGGEMRKFYSSFFGEVACG